jgi:hypothetical protein
VKSTNSNQPRLNPWLSIWTQPRPTIRQVMQTVSMGKLMWVGILIMFVSMVTSDRVQRLENLFPFKNIDPLLAYSLIVGSSIPIGMLFLWLFAWMAKVTGRWLGSQARIRDIVYALVWPGVMTIFVRICMFSIGFIFATLCDFYGILIAFSGDMAWLTWTFYGAMGLAALIFYSWFFAVYFICMSEVMKISKLRAFFVWLLAVIFATLLITVLVVVAVILTMALVNS